jgi:hypothetical protein
MSSRDHEMWLELLRERPALAADLVDCVRSGLVPAFSHGRLESGDLSEHAPAAYHADALVTFGGEERASWARRPIPLGHPGLVLTPLVLGPEEVPVLTYADTDNVAPEIAVMSAVVHGAGPDGPKVLAAMVESVEKIESEQARGHIDEVLAVLPEAARDLLETILKTRAREYKSDFARRYYGQGKAEGKAGAVLDVLSARGIDVPEQARGLHARVGLPLQAAGLGEDGDLDAVAAVVGAAAALSPRQVLHDHRSSMILCM